MTDYIVRHDRVLIRPDAPKTKTASGLHLGGSNGQITRGTVITCGPGYLLEDGKRAPIDLEEGDRVIFDLFERPATMIPHEDDDTGSSEVLLLVLDSQIVTKLENEPLPLMDFPDGEEGESDDEEEAAEEANDDDDDGVPKKYAGRRRRVLSVS